MSPARAGLPPVPVPPVTVPPAKEKGKGTRKKKKNRRVNRAERASAAETGVAAALCPEREEPDADATAPPSPLPGPAGRTEIGEVEERVVDKEGGFLKVVLTRCSSPLLGNSAREKRRRGEQRAVFIPLMPMSAAAQEANPIYFMPRSSVPLGAEERVRGHGFPAQAPAVSPPAGPREEVAKTAVARVGNREQVEACWRHPRPQRPQTKKISCGRTRRRS